MIRTLIVTSFGLGKIRPAPGSWGSLPPCLIAASLLFLGADPIVNRIAQITIAIAASMACVALGAWAERKYKGKDPGVVVIDEVAGMAVSLIFLPTVLPTTTGELGSTASGFLIILAAFILFRIFDIIKVQPANLMQQFPAGWGILLDDLIAGVYVNLLLQVVLRILLPWLIS